MDSMLEGVPKEPRARFLRGYLYREWQERNPEGKTIQDGAPTNGDCEAGQANSTDDGQHKAAEQPEPKEVAAEAAAGTAASGTTADVVAAGASPAQEEAAKGERGMAEAPAAAETTPKATEAAWESAAAGTETAPVKEPATEEGAPTPTVQDSVNPPEESAAVAAAPGTGEAGNAVANPEAGAAEAGAAEASQEAAVEDNSEASPAKALVTSEAEVPNQENGFDCGVFVLEFLTHLLLNPGSLAELGLTDHTDWFQQSQISYRREQLRVIAERLEEEARERGQPDVAKLLEDDALKAEVVAALTSLPEEVSEEEGEELSGYEGHEGMNEESEDASMEPDREEDVEDEEAEIGEPPAKRPRGEETTEAPAEEVQKPQQSLEDSGRVENAESGLQQPPQDPAQERPQDQQRQQEQQPQAQQQLEQQPQQPSVAEPQQPIPMEVQQQGQPPEMPQQSEQCQLSESETQSASCQPQHE